MNGESGWDPHRNADGTFRFGAGLPDQGAQRAAGVGPHDSFATAMLKVEEQERWDRRVANGTLPWHAGAGAPSRDSEPSAGDPAPGAGGSVFGWLLLFFFLGIFAAAIWAHENRAGLGRAFSAWALEAAFRDERFAPLEAYGEFVPREAKLPEPATREFIRRLERAGSGIMRGPRGRALSASAWKCVSERPGCLRESSAAAPAGAAITLAAAERFLERARSEGSAEAAADLGLMRVRYAWPDSALALARAEWEKGIGKNPGAARAKALLERSKDFWALRLLDGMADFPSSAKAALGRMRP